MAAAFDLAEGVEGDADLVGDGGGRTGASGGAEDLDQGPASVALLVGQWGAHHVVTYRSPREWERMRDAGRVVARILRDA
jgi:hypothetical protein